MEDEDDDSAESVSESELIDVVGEDELSLSSSCVETTLDVEAFAGGGVEEVDAEVLFLIVDSRTAPLTK